ncbi:uncharacterized protein CTRU02_207012 [Colletotrichum truncatum]|uniref:Uncharacterized protein n=1 Tax=Colletotrichum truncatum TaxID=5467 RepID=A0ACC3YZP9_COLTU
MDLFCLIFGFLSAPLGGTTAGGLRETQRGTSVVICGRGTREVFIKTFTTSGFRETQTSCNQHDWNKRVSSHRQALIAASKPKSRAAQAVDTWIPHTLELQKKEESWSIASYDSRLYREIDSPKLPMDLQSVERNPSKQQECYRGCFSLAGGSLQCLGKQNTHVLKRKKKYSDLRTRYQNLQSSKQQVEKSRVRSVSISQLPAVSPIPGENESVLVLFPSFESANIEFGKLGQLLEVERKLAQYKDADQDQDEWGFDSATVDQVDWIKDGHKNIVTYNTYSETHIIQQIYEGLDDLHDEDFATSIKFSRDLLFSNYKDGSYKKVQYSNISQKTVKCGNWGFAALCRTVRRLF